MKLRMVVLGLGVMAATFLTTSVFAARHAVVTAPPVQGDNLAIVVNADTVTGPGAGAATCAQDNLFKRGDMIVFRAWGSDVPTGGSALTDTNVSSAQINIPGLDTPLDMTYAAHGATPSTQVGYWEAHWTVPSDYPLGVINFNIVVKTLKTPHLPPLSGRFSQKGFSSASRLQVTA